ncbi:MAG: zinc ribbon domain-containing protein, partial [Clostridiales bacterium]|nr:zinc ribbon domain-containing protein [Clostridiales bacterium]
LHREVFSISEEAIKAEATQAQRILIERTPAIQQLRKRFLGRAIHRSLESWKKSLLDKIEKAPSEPISSNTARFCASCGARLITGVKFCNECGARQAT